ncbi:MAG: O-antigen ligase family protein [Candidatus Kryptoniota bacterium]
MAQVFLFLFPFSYIFSFLGVAPLGTIDLWCIVFGAFFLFCQRAVKYDKSSVIDNRLIILYFLYCISAILSLWNNPNCELSSIYHAFTIIAKVGISVFVYYAITSVKDLRLCILSLILFNIGIILCVIFLAYSHNSFFFLREDSLIRDDIFQYAIISKPNVLNRAVLLTVSIIYVYSFFLKDRIAILGIRFISISCLLLPIMGISRMAMASMMLMMIVIFWKMRRKFMILTLLIIAIIGFTLPNVQNRFEEVVQRGYSLGHREETAEVSLRNIKQNPLLGLGKRSSIGILERSSAPVTGKDRRIIFEHNMVLAMLLEDGIIGLTIFLSLLFVYIKFLLDSMRKMKNPMFKYLIFACLMGFIGFMLTTLTGGTINENILWYQVGLSLAIIKLDRKEQGYNSSYN